MTAHGSETASPPADDGDSRRSFVGKACGATMVGALTVSYGTLFSYAGKFLYPAKATPKAWMFVVEVMKMKVGDSLSFKTPDGSRVAIARQADKGDVSDFIALSSTCPHLGCQVHWEGQSNRFFCPCHNGAFDPTGKPISGPPADAGQSLPQFPLKVENGLLFIEVETQTLASASDSVPTSEEVNGGAA